MHARQVINPITQPPTRPASSDAQRTKEQPVCLAAEMFSMTICAVVVGPRGATWTKQFAKYLRDGQEADIVALVIAFRAGTTDHIPAKRYGIAEESLRKPLREEGIKRQPSTTSRHKRQCGQKELTKPGGTGHQTVLTG